jgi:hypothetical protein
MTVLHMRGAKEAPRKDASRMETLLVTPEVLESWTLPGFQRALRENAKVRELAGELRANGGIIPGVITLGKVAGDSAIYLLDGQHRRLAAILSELNEFIADVRMPDFTDMAEMGEEYVRLNTAIVKMRPDDVLQGLEASMASLKTIRKKCPFVGYDQVRRGPSSPMVSMSSVLRCWRMSSTDTPGGGSTGSALSIARSFEDEEVDGLCGFLIAAKLAWGTDPEYYRLWGNLNMTLCMWLFHQLVLRRERGVKTRVMLDGEQFYKCLMAVSAASDYVEWLTGRNLGDRDRSPCYGRLKAIFVGRVRDLPGVKGDKLPAPVWASNPGRTVRR